MTMQTELVAFNPTEIATTGAQLFQFVIEHERRKNLAEAELADADRRDEMIDAELIRYAIFLHGEEKIDVHSIFQGNKDATQLLYRTYLTNLGVLERVEQGDQFVYNYASEELKAAYELSAELKKENETEYKTRHGNINARNMRMQRVMKAAVALIDAGADHSDIVVTKDDETGETEIVLNKAPADFAGKAEKVVLQGRGSTKYEGAKVTPTISGLAKVSTAAHKVAPKEESKADAESTDRPAADGRMSEEDLLATCNMLTMAIKGRENVFTKSELTALANVASTITQIKPA